MADLTKTSQDDSAYPWEGYCFPYGGGHCNHPGVCHSSPGPTITPEVIAAARAMFPGCTERSDRIRAME